MTTILERAYRKFGYHAEFVHSELTRKRHKYEGYVEGANEQLHIDIDNACEALYGLANDLGCDLLDIDLAKEYLREKMMESA